jgi:6-phosphogluconate dehydrogenase
MQLGMIGLGRMGGNMVRRLMKAGHDCAVYDLDATRVQELQSAGARGASKLDELIAALAKPRAAWIMVPAGKPTEDMVGALAERLAPGDVIIDGGNSYYKDDIRRAKLVAPKGIDYMDTGTSGGVWGLERGYCLMVGGKPEVFQRIEPIFRSLAPGRTEIPDTPGRKMTTAELGYIHCGPVGSGHFVKMIHNGIEYGLMQAYGEGFDILKNAGSDKLEQDCRYDLDLAEIAEVWRRGSVVSSWLLDLSAMALTEDPSLKNFTGFVQDSGEGRWTIQAGLEEAVPSPVLAASLYARFRSRQEHTFADKMLSAMRNKFGGHLEQATGG